MSLHLLPHNSIDPVRWRALLPGRRCLSKKKRTADHSCRHCVRDGTLLIPTHVDLTLNVRLTCRPFLCPHKRRSRRYSPARGVPRPLRPDHFYTNDAANLGTKLATEHNKTSAVEFRRPIQCQGRRCNRTARPRVRPPRAPACCHRTGLGGGRSGRMGPTRPCVRPRRLARLWSFPRATGSAVTARNSRLCRVCRMGRHSGLVERACGGCAANRTMPCRNGWSRRGELCPDHCISAG